MRLLLVPGLLALLAAPCGPADASEGSPSPSPGPPEEVVVLLHGHGRTARSMEPMRSGLEEEGFRVVNIGYPSRQHAIEDLARYLGEELAACCADPDLRVHFVTHSMGGILVRQFLAANDFPQLGRVVMLSPPNQGTELVDLFRRNRGLSSLSGPSPLELGTDPGSAPSRLGPVGFEAGVIAGNRSWNPLFSGLIPGDDDGMVAVERMKVEGMADFIVVPHTHTFIMRSDEVLAQTLHFIRTGRFDHGRTGPVPDPTDP